MPVRNCLFFVCNFSILLKTKTDANDRKRLLNPKLLQLTTILQALELCAITFP